MSEAIAAARCNLCRRKIADKPHHVTRETGELVHSACAELRWRLTILEADSPKRHQVRGGAA